jgi:hypothetical protein
VSGDKLLLHAEEVKWAETGTLTETKEKAEKIEGGRLMTRVSFVCILTKFSRSVPLVFQAGSVPDVNRLGTPACVRTSISILIVCAHPSLRTTHVCLCDCTCSITWIWSQLQSLQVLNCNTRLESYRVMLVWEG